MYTYTIEQIVYIMELHHNINLYNIIATQISSKLTYRHGNLESKKKSSRTRLLLGIDLEHVMN